MRGSQRVGVGVLVSGQGTNLQALLEVSSGADFPARVVAVGSNRPACPALELARSAGVPEHAFPKREFGGDALARDGAMADWLLAKGARILVLAGYDQILSDTVLEAFPQGVLNLHNSLLPAFGGTMHAVEEALQEGVKVTGCTVHLVVPGRVDRGPIVLQAPVAVEDDDTAQSLLCRIHREEWRILPEAVRLLAEGRTSLEGRRVRIREGAP